MPRRLVVIGGNAAGMSAASEARRRKGRDDLEIVVFERSTYVSYSSCGEPYYVGGYVDALDDLVVRTPQQFLARDIDVRIRHEVAAIDAAARRVTVRRLDGDAEAGPEQTLDYDELLYAAGARAQRPPIPGIDLPGVHELRTLDDAHALRQRTPALRRAVVAGGGYIGLEAAEAFQNLGIATTVITASETVLEPQLDADMGRHVQRAMEGIGIEVVTGTPVEAFEGDADGVRSARAGDRTYDADVVLLGLGSAPEVTLALDAGLPLGETGALAVDPRQRTPVEGVWAAGDCSEAVHRLTGRPVNFHLGTVANKQGRIAGINLGGGESAFPGVLGTAITRVCSLEIARTGLTAAEAADAGFDAESVVFESLTTAGYWPEAAPLTMKAVVDRPSRRLLGAQIVGGAGAGKRIDAVAMALWNEMTVDALVNVDLSYAPPFSGVWDPVLVAARKALDLLD